MILIIVGGKQESFEVAMNHLKRNIPVLVIDGSGGSADFISKGYRMSMKTTCTNELVILSFIIVQAAFLAVYL